MSEDRTQQLPDGDMKQVLALLNSINTRLTALEEKVDRRLQETRPIWEQVLSRLTEIETRLSGVESRLGSVEKRLEKVEGEVYSFNRKMRVYYDDLLKMQDKQEDFDERLRRLESEPAR
jgi:DNA repair ATPase RecN